MYTNDERLSTSRCVARCYCSLSPVAAMQPVFVLRCCDRQLLVAAGRCSYSWWYPTLSLMCILAIIVGRVSEKSECGLRRQARGQDSIAKPSRVAQMVQVWFAFRSWSAKSAQTQIESRIHATGNKVPHDIINRW